MWFIELQWKVWSATDLGLVLLAGVLNESVPGGHFPLLFHYFDEVRKLIKCIHTYMYSNEIKSNVNNSYRN